MYPAQANKDCTVFRERLSEVDATFGHLLEALLKAHQGEGSPPTSKPSTTRSSCCPAEKLGDQVGQYTLRKQIGEAGCSVTYMAEQRESIRRRVAVNVVKPGMELPERFEASHHALAKLDHPNLARFLEAGTTKDGRHYFVMELVQGVPLTQYCELHELSIEARLGLFVQVCLAIQHAHQRGLVHGDVRPSNMLLANSEPGSPAIPKVIGFGIIGGTTDQPLQDKANVTAFGKFGRTPAYVSPEQASWKAIDTRSDIYSLGVLLYELLTGRTPFETKRLIDADQDELCRIIADEVPSRPSTKFHDLDAAVRMEVARQRRSQPPNLLQRLRGDLDSIVMKCLEKEPARRYGTADELAGDIQRYLNNEPVSAHPPGRAHKFQKTMGLLHKVGLMWIA
jgi:serine/threonine protein kinase